jgi:outer membrane protein assembly factor BamB
MPGVARRPQASKQHSGRRKWLIPLTLALFAMLLTGCGAQVSPYWPDLSVDGDTVYVTNGRFFALKADTGDAMWAYPAVEQKSGGLLSGCSAPKITDGPFIAAPVVQDELIFLGSGGEIQRSLWGKGENMAGLRALNKLGTLQWRFEGATGGTIAAPALAGTTVYLPSSDHNVYAVDLETRQARWVFQTGNWVWATPLILEGTAYIASMDHVLYAVDDQTGGARWQFDRSSSALPAAPAFDGGVLYLGALGGTMYAIEAQSGELAWEQKVDGGVWATPIIENGVLYFGTLKGAIYALRTTDGTQVWTKNVEGEVRGTPAYVNGTLYFGCESGRLYAFDAQNGDELMSPLGMQLEKASIYTSPVFDGTYLYVVSTSGEVFALDVKRNAIVWQNNPLADQEE